MKKLELFFCLLFCLFFVNVYAQNLTYQRLNGQWEKYIEADEHEKDFRTQEMLRLIERSVDQGVNFPDSTSFLPGWSSDSTADNRFMVHTTYIRFSGRADQVLYCYQDKNNSEVFAGYKSLNTKYKKAEVRPVLKSVIFSGTMVVELNYYSGEEKILNIPDLELAMKIETLMRSNGEDAAFEISEWIGNRLELLMQQESLFNNDFSGYAGISTLMSKEFEDEIKISTWNVENLGGDHFFFGVIALKKGERIKIFRLLDSRNEITNAELKSLTHSNWFGAVYYDIIPVKDGNSVYYTLLGYNGNDAFSRIRLIDVLTFGKQGEPRFGATIFDVKERMRRRLIYEHSNRANMMLRYDERKDRIVMDHLAPMEPRFEGDRSYYGPDFSYDILEFQKGKWVLEEDVDVRNR